MPCRTDCTVRGTGTPDRVRIWRRRRFEVILSPVQVPYPPTELDCFPNTNRHRKVRGTVLPPMGERRSVRPAAGSEAQRSVGQKSPLSKTEYSNPRNAPGLSFFHFWFVCNCVMKPSRVYQQRQGYRMTNRGTILPRRGSPSVIPLSRMEEPGSKPPFC